MKIRSKMTLASTMAITVLLGSTLLTGQVHAGADAELDKIQPTTKGPIPDSELLKKHQLEGYQERGAAQVKMPSSAPIPDSEHLKQERREGLVDNPRSAQ